MDQASGNTTPKTNSRRATDKAIVVRGGAGLSRRQLATLRSGGGAQFPPLKSVSLITRPKDDMSPSAKEYAMSLYSKLGPKRLANSFYRMVINPFDAEEGQRYPDDSIVPTGMVNLRTSSTYTVDATASTNGFLSYLNWKVTDVSGALHGTLGTPFAITTAATVGDYGTPQAAWRALVSSDRTLACAVRVRLMGLPTSTFVPSGTLYFMQYQPGELTGSFDTESECIQAVTARKGFSITLAEIARLGAVHLPFLPQGPMSYLFSASNSYPASGYPDSAAPTPVASVVSPNGGLVVAGFGLQPTVVLRFDYCHHVEYIPKVTAAGLIHTAVEAPNTMARDQISQITARSFDSYAGGTSASDLHVLRGAGSSGEAMVPWNPRPRRNPLESTGMSTLDSMVSTLSSLSGAANVLGNLW